MDKETFENFCSLIYRESGIVLGMAKKSLLENRIQKRLRSLEIANESKYLQIIETDQSGAELIKLVDLISTNVTFFNREPLHFEFLAKQCKDWNNQDKPSLKIWCAAASSGEEPYTIAMTVAENINLKKTSVKILATDICTRVLDQALQGLYPSNELSTLSSHLKQIYFRENEVNQEKFWEVSSKLRELVLFKRLNLVRFPYPLKGSLDVVFCRNVMIYFDRVTKQLMVDEFSRLLSPGGYLILGCAESLLGLKTTFQKVGVSIFQKSALGLNGRE